MSWLRSTETPEPGRRVVGVFKDRSGAVLLWRHYDGFIDAEGDDFSDEWWRLNVEIWSYLPDEIEFWCENCAEDPMTLRLPPKREEAPPS